MAQVAQDQIDHDKAAQIRQMLAQEGEQAVQHRYGERELDSPEYRQAKQDLDRANAQQRKARMGAADEQETARMAAEQEARRQAELEAQRQAELEAQRQAEIQRQAELQEQQAAEQRPQEPAREGQARDGQGDARDRAAQQTQQTQQTQQSAGQEACTEATGKPDQDSRGQSPSDMFDAKVREAEATQSREGLGR